MPLVKTLFFSLSFFLSEAGSDTGKINVQKVRLYIHLHAQSEKLSMVEEEIPERWRAATTVTNLVRESSSVDWVPERFQVY